MRNWLYKARGLKFYDADSGGNSGGAGGSGGSPTGGQEFKLDIASLMKDLPLDELDEASRKKFEDARKQITDGVATLQTNLQLTTKQARDFQSQKDQFAKQLELANKGGQPPAEDDYLKAVKDVMAKNGYKPEIIEQQAGVFAEMFKQASGLIIKDVGTRMRPMATAVTIQQARDAFSEAQDKDGFGILAIPEVAEKVWQAVQERVENNAVTNPDIVLNLAKMLYTDHVVDLSAKGKELPKLKVKAAGDNVNQGTQFTYPGAGRGGSGIPIVSRAVDPNGAKHQMNSDTEAAVTSTFKNMTKGMELKTKPPILDKV